MHVGCCIWCRLVRLFFTLSFVNSLLTQPSAHTPGQWSIQLLSRVRAFLLAVLIANNTFCFACVMCAPKLKFLLSQITTNTNTTNHRCDSVSSTSSKSQPLALLHGFANTFCSRDFISVFLSGENASFMSVDVDVYIYVSATQQKKFPCVSFTRTLR